MLACVDRIGPRPPLLLGSIVCMASPFCDCWTRVIARLMANDGHHVNELNRKSNTLIII